MLTPEQHARRNIDEQLKRAVWAVQDYKSLNLSAAFGIAVREYPMGTGRADYLLFVDRKPMGVIEAKKADTVLSGVHEQTTRYAAGSIKHLLTKENIPFQYESTGIETVFSDTRDPSPRQRLVFNFHKPETLDEWFRQNDSLRKRLQCHPSLDTTGLRLCQVNAITNLERSFAGNRPDMGMGWKGVKEISEQ